MEFTHRSVLLEEAVEGLNIRPDGIYLDGTVGGGGHSEKIAESLTAGGRLIGMDQDETALGAAADRLARFGNRITLLHDNFENAAERLKTLGVERINGVLLDLGVSSHQFDCAERGFSYRADAPLDMRMDRTQGLTAAEIVNTWEETELLHILRDYGEERFAGAIARKLVETRTRTPIRTTMELNAVIDEAIPARIRRRTEGHPARKTYQALRIACNRELDVLTRALETLVHMIGPDGRFAVITFHSLEDRIVKNAFRTWENPCSCPPEFPVCVCGKRSLGRVVTKKPITPGEQELEENPRSRSAKLRVFERDGEG